MTERGRAAVIQERDRLTIGPSALTWDEGVLTLAIDEIAAPLPSKIKGTVRVVPRFLNAGGFRLDAHGRHVWRPIAPAARVDVDLTHPAIRWSGEGYLDTNFGAEPLEDCFAHWTWSRTALSGGAAILYDVTRRDGGTLNLGIRFDASGVAQAFAPPPCVSLPPTLWRIDRAARSEAKPGEPGSASVLRTLEDAPFYARSLVSTRLFGETIVSMHESLSLRRFAQSWVKILLPFKMPRALWRSP